MATTNLSLNQPAYNSASWDVPINANETILDSQLAGTTSISLTNANVTLTSPNTSGTGQTQAMRIVLTGALAANVQVIIPSGISGKWIVYNTTSGSYTVTIASGGGGTSVIATQGYNTSVYSDGTNIRLTDDGLGTVLPVLTVNGTATFNGLSNFVGSTSTLGINLKNIAETVTISGSSATGTINFDVTTQSILYYTGNAAANFTLNIRGNSSYALNTLLATNQAITVVFMNTNGSTAYYNNVLQIDGSTITPKWQGASAPTSGNSSSVDIYTYTIIKTANATYTVLGNLNNFA